MRNPADAGGAAPLLPAELKVCARRSWGREGSAASRGFEGTQRPAVSGGQAEWGWKERTNHCWICGCAGLGGRGRSPSESHAGVGGRWLSALLLCENACLQAFWLGRGGDTLGGLGLYSLCHPPLFFLNGKDGFFEKMIL